MDDFANLTTSFKFLPTKSSPIKSSSSAATFTTTTTNNSSKNMADSIFQNATNKTKTTSFHHNAKPPVYANNNNSKSEDIFDGLKTKSMSCNSSSLSAMRNKEEDNVVDSMSKSKRSEISHHFDDLIPEGFTSESCVVSNNNRSNTEPIQKSAANTKETSNAMDDPFVVLESTSTAANSYQSFSTDPLDEIGNVSKSGVPEVRGSSVSGSVFDDIDALNAFGKSAPAFTCEMNNTGKDQRPLNEDSGMGRACSSTSKDSTQKTSFGYSESRAPVDDYRESHQTVFNIPEISGNHHRSFDQSTSPPSYMETNSQTSQRADDIWLTVSEIPLFTLPTKAPPPTRPPPSIRSHILKPERGSFLSKSRKAVNGVSSPKVVTGRMQNDSGAYVDTQCVEDMDSTLAAAAAMKQAMDRAEAKFRHAKEVRQRENEKASKNEESMQPDRDEHREKEEEEREKRRLEKERMREVERANARQAVDRATREVRERAASKAREKASDEACLKAERAAVQRALAEASERVAVGAKERAERASVEAREKVEEDVRRRAERAVVERIAAEARKRAAIEARDRAAASRMNQQKNDNDFESFFSTGTRPSSAPRPRASSPDFSSDTLSHNKRGPEGSYRTSTAGVSSNMRKASSTTSIVDDLSSIFGATPKSGQFQEVQGETEERRRARLEREQRTQERAATALAEKNWRDLQSQREQEERHRIGGALDTQVKRWAAGKEGNLRVLLSTLQFVLWPECGWQPVSLTDVITGANVKKAYRKATLCIHPDKVQQKGATLQQKYIAEKVFYILKEAWNKFNSEELF